MTPVKHTFAFLPVFLLAVAADAELKSWDRYQCIIDRAPFGPIYREDDPRFNSTPEPTPTQEPVDEGPKLSDIIKLSAITVYGGVPAAGFTDSTDNKSYYLYQGKSAGDFTLVEVYADTKSILLRKGTQEEIISMNSNTPAEAPAPGKPPAAVSAVPSTRPGRTPGYMDRQRQRVEEERKKAREEAKLRAEEERRKYEEEMSKLTTEEREKKLREYNMELIRTGKGPPLPIELNREELVQLGEEGFDVAEAIQALDEREAQPKEDRAEKIRRLREEARARREKEAQEKASGN